MSRGYRIVVAIALLITAGYAYWRFAIPVHRVAIQSELIMLGDLDGDHRWTTSMCGVRVTSPAIHMRYRIPLSGAWT